jgi:hypothetical protein
LSALGTDFGLVTDGLEIAYTILERRIVQIGDIRLDDVLEALEAGVGLRCTSIQLGDVLALTLGSLLPPVEHRGEDRFQALGLKQAVFQTAGDKIVQLVRRYRHALASGRPLPGSHGAGGR